MSKTKRKAVAWKTRNGNTWSEAEYFSKIRSVLRKAFMYWKPMIIARDTVRRPYSGNNKHRKWEYQCAECKNWFSQDQIHIDHIIPCGSLKSYDDIIPFLLRLTPEDPKAFQVLCKEHHQEKTNKERNERKVIKEKDGEENSIN